MKKILPAITFLLLAASCTERIDIATGTQAPKLVISANISSEPSRQTVWVSKTVPYFGGAAAQGVGNAQVFIDGVALTPSDSVAGEYHTVDSFFVAAGQSCRLRVLYDLDGDGAPEEFTATEVMRQSVTLDTLMLLKIGFDTGRYVPPFILAAGFTRSLADDCFAADMHYGNRNMLRTLGDYPVDKIPHGLYGGAAVFALTISGSAMDMGNGDTLRLCPFDTLNVSISSIPPSTLSFLQSAQEELWGGDPMFSGPPANISTNITGGGVVGCFALRNVSNRKGVVLPMNVKTLNGTWAAQDGSGRRIAINDGVATAGSATYFSNVQVDPAIRGFRADMDNHAAAQFRMENYNEFAELLPFPELSPEVKTLWKRASWRAN